MDLDSYTCELHTTERENMGSSISEMWLWQGMLGNGQDHANPFLESTHCSLRCAKEFHTTLVHGDNDHNDVVHLEMQKWFNL
jgi:hypothetical protein